MLNSHNYNPDVLTCLANLSNDEVFTPPQMVNQILDLLPEEIWSDKNARFLDPVCKSGVFLREIAKRLMLGLEKKFPTSKPGSTIFSKISFLGSPSRSYLPAFTQIACIALKQPMGNTPFAKLSRSTRKYPL